MLQQMSQVSKTRAEEQKALELARKRYEEEEEEEMEMTDGETTGVPSKYNCVCICGDTLPTLCRYQ